MGVRIWHRRTAAATEGSAIGRRIFKQGCFIARDKLLSLQQMKIFSSDAYHGGERRAGHFTATVTVAQFKRADGAGNFKAHAPAQATSSDHMTPEFLYAQQYAQ